MTLTEIRQIAKGRYGLARTATEDALFTDTVLTDLVNEAHRWLAREAWLYYESDRTETLVNAQRRYALDSDVIRLDPATVRINFGGSYAVLAHRLQGSLMQQYGALESTADGTPVAFFLAGGELTNDEGTVVTLYPAPNGAGTLLYAAWVYPAALANDSDRPPFQASEHDRLIPAVCWKMAELDRSRGRAEAPVEYWAQMAVQAKDELLRAQRDGGYPVPRGRVRGFGGNPE